MKFLAENYPDFYTFLIRDFLYDMSFHISVLVLLFMVSVVFSLMFLKIINPTVRYFLTPFLWFFILLSMIVSYLFIFFFWFYFLIEDKSQKDFTRQEWQNNPDKRYWYVDSLLSNQTLLGKSAVDIVALLGSPLLKSSLSNEQSMLRVSDLCYPLKRRDAIIFRTKKQTNYLKAEDRYLLIWLDKIQDTVIKYEVW